MLRPDAGWQTLLTDPVCGRSVEFDSPHRIVYGGALFAFCGPTCRTQFAALPSRYAVIAGARPAAHGANSVPMQPGGDDPTTDRAGPAPVAGASAVSLPTAPPAARATSTERATPVVATVRSEGASSPSAASASAPPAVPLQHPPTWSPTGQAGEGRARPTWLTAWRERRYARRCAREMLALHHQAVRSEPTLAGRPLYRRIVRTRLHCSEDDAEALLTRAEQSFAIWPITRALCYRDVVHYIAVSQFIAAHPGARWVYADIKRVVDRLVASDL